jgi:lipopolysaccharide export system protein LptA
MRSKTGIDAVVRIAVAAVFAFGAVAPAHSEKADRNKPIHLEADRVTVDDAKQIATFIGNVVLTQGTMTLRGDRMEVRQDKDGFRQGVTVGNLAYFRQKRDGYDEFIEAWAERIEYDSRADKLQMFNRAMMKRGPDEVRGNYISYDVATEFFQVTGGTKSAAAKPGDGRVRAILQPKPKENSPAQPAVPLRSDQTTDAQRGETGAGAK